MFFHLLDHILVYTEVLNFSEAQLIHVFLLMLVLSVSYLRFIAKSKVIKN